MFLNSKKNLLFLKYSKLNYKLLVILWDLNIINYFNFDKNNNIFKIYLNIKSNLSKVKFFSSKKFNFYIYYKNYYKLKNFFYIIIINNKLFLLKDFLKKKKKKGLILCKFY